MKNIHVRRFAKTHWSGCTLWTRHIVITSPLIYIEIAFFFSVLLFCTFWTFQSLKYHFYSPTIATFITAEAQNYWSACPPSWGWKASLLKSITGVISSQNHTPSHHSANILLGSNSKPHSIFHNAYFCCCFFGHRIPNSELNVNSQSVSEPETESPSQVCFAGKWPRCSGGILGGYFFFFLRWFGKGGGVWGGGGNVGEVKELHSYEQVQSWAKQRMMDWALSGLQLVLGGNK